jgi:hypothetical protein
MIKILRVALHEYKQHVFNKRFLMGLLSVPLTMLLMVGLVFLIRSSCPVRTGRGRAPGLLRPARRLPVCR